MPETLDVTIYTVEVTYQDWMRIVNPDWTVPDYFLFIQESPKVLVQYFCINKEYEDSIYWRLIEGWGDDDKSPWKQTLLEGVEIVVKFNRVRKLAGEPGF